jgi:hypothetical protein
MTFQQLIKDFDPNEPAITLDFETYYDDECSASTLSYYHYTNHLKFDAYLVAIVSDDFKWVGHPKDAPWEKLQTYPIWVAHNAPFDRAVHQSLVDNGLVPKFFPKAWANTADMMSYLKYPRSLKGSVAEIYGAGLNKKARADMKGRKFEEICEADQKEMVEYALDDSVWTHRLWTEFKSQWPRHEQLLSMHTGECVRRGVRVDLDKLERYSKIAVSANEKAESLIPWAGEQERTAKGTLKWKRDGSPVMLAPTSTLKLAEFARSQNVPMPTSTEAKSEEFQAWEAEWGVKFPVIKAIQTWRKTNRIVRLLEQVKSRVRPDGRMELQLCYFGADTGRWSGRPGGAGDDDEKSLNMQNLIKETLYFDDLFLTTKGKTENEINFRSLFVGEPTFVMSDLAAIEPRTVAVLCGDIEFVKKCKSGQSPYEAHSRDTMGWTGGNLKKENPKIYALAKARLIALSYQTGWKRFISMASLYVSGEVFNQVFKQPVSDQDTRKFLTYLSKYGKDDYLLYEDLDEDVKRVWVNSWVQVMDFRNGSPKLTALWKRLDQDYKRSASRGEDYHVRLPSGRTLSYFKISKTHGTAEAVRGGRRKNVHSGVIIENISQAVARDAFAECILNLEAEGFKVLWHVHDEVIVDTDNVEEVTRIMSQPPHWCKSLPIACEAEASPYYKK